MEANHFERFPIFETSAGLAINTKWLATSFFGKTHVSGRLTRIVHRSHSLIPCLSNQQDHELACLLVMVCLLDRVLGKMSLNAIGRDL